MTWSERSLTVPDGRTGFSRLCQSPVIVLDACKDGWTLLHGGFDYRLSIKVAIGSSAHAKRDDLAPIWNMGLALHSHARRAEESDRGRITASMTPRLRRVGICGFIGQSQLLLEDTHVDRDMQDTNNKGTITRCRQ